MEEVKKTHGRKAHSLGRSHSMPKKGTMAHRGLTVKQWNTKVRGSGGKQVRSKQQQKESLHTDLNCPHCPVPHRKNWGKGTDH